MSSFSRLKRQRSNSHSSVNTDVTAPDTPLGSPQEIITPQTVLLTPRGINTASGQEQLIHRYHAYNDIMKLKQKYKLHIFKHRLFDKDGNIEYDIRTANKKLFYLVPATKEDLKQSNNGEIILYNKNGQRVQTNDLFNELNSEQSSVSNLSSNISNNTSNEDLNSIGSGSMYKTGGKKRKTSRRGKKLGKKTLKKKYKQ